MTSIKQLFVNHEPGLCFHRGYSLIAPENTFSAFDAALRIGGTMIEFDCRLTKDNELAVIHDALVNRTSNGKGHVSNLTMKQMSQLDFGSWFSDKFRNERIPTLSEVFDFTKNKIALNIEIKVDKGFEQDSEIVRQCYEIIRSYKAEETTLVSSSFIPVISQMKRFDKRIATGALYHSSFGFGKDPIEIASSAKADYLILNGSAMRKKIVDNSHAKNILVGEYTINTHYRFKRAQRFGVDAIIANDPSLFAVK
jgi:glycerophosphoryl diester phosphodiesterase